MQYQVLIRAAGRMALLIGALSWLAAPSYAQESTTEQVSPDQPSQQGGIGEGMAQKAKSQSPERQRDERGAAPDEVEFQKAKHQQD